MALGAQEFYPDGTDLAQFINKYKADLMNKHVLYIIKANTKGDSNIYKIGKSTIGVSRLLSYQHVYGIKRKGTPQSGAKLFWIKKVPARQPGQGGQLLVNRMEKALKLTMLAEGATLAAGRGSERFVATKSQVAEAVANFDDVFKEYNRDFLQQEVRRQPVREATMRGFECRRVVKEPVGVQTRSGKKACPEVTCEPVIKYVAPEDLPEEQPRATRAPRKERAALTPVFEVDQRVKVRYEDGKDYIGKVVRSTAKTIDVLFGNEIATIPRRQFSLVKAIRRTRQR